MVTDNLRTMVDNLRTMVSISFTRNVFLSIGLLLCLACANRTGNSSKSYYPFQLAGREGMYTLVVPVEDKKIMDQYHKLFTSNGLSGNGYTWEAIIKYILEKEGKELLPQVHFDSEAGSFYAFTTTKDSQVQFAKLLAPIFADEKKLRSFVEKVSRDEIDD